MKGPIRSAPSAAVSSSSVVLSLACSLALVSCSSSTPDAAPGANSVACGPGELVLEGALGGAPINVREAYSGMGFINKLNDDKPGSFSGNGPTARFAFTFDTILSSNQTTAARGSLRLGAAGDAGAPIEVGNCETGSADSVLSYTSGATFDDPSTYRFTLRSGKKSPYCTGEPLDGEVRGCLQTKPRK